LAEDKVRGEEKGVRWKRNMEDRERHRREGTNGRAREVVREDKEKAKGNEKGRKKEKIY